MKRNDRSSLVLNIQVYSCAAMIIAGGIGGFIDYATSDRSNRDPIFITLTVVGIFGLVAFTHLSALSKRVRHLEDKSDHPLNQ